ncbi:MAG: hypothetical protein K1X36_08085 [Pyrinomonadaceae bacterium]|nr:hypothetical protein [Pyrinomonadaceae bacterium]
MNKTRTIFAAVGLVLVVSLIGGACSFSVGTNSTESPSNKPVAINTNSGTPSPTSPPAPSKNVDIAGKYDAVGTNPDGGGEYKAELTVTKRDDVYQFSWVSGKSSYDGVGVLMDGEVAVSYTDGPDGKGCGVVLYKIAADGSMNGKVGYWGTNTMETESAKRTSGTDLEGSYDIEGKNPEGKSYKGKLDVKKEGEGYRFNWDAGSQFSGFGIRAGEFVAVGFGGKQCSFVGYDVKADGTLDGKWGGQGSTKFGTETAKRK